MAARAAAIAWWVLERSFEPFAMPFRPLCCHSAMAGTGPLHAGRRAARFAIGGSRPLYRAASVRAVRAVRAVRVGKLGRFAAL